MLYLLSDVMPIFALPLYALCAVTPVVIIALIIFFAVKKKRGRKDGFDKVLSTPDYVREKTKTEDASIDELSKQAEETAEVTNNPSQQ